LTTIDFQSLIAQAKTASFDALPVGDYDLECVEATPKPTSTGKEMVKAKYKVIAGPSAGRTVFNQYVLSPENATALAIFFRDMQAHGLDETFFTQLQGVEQPMAVIAARLPGTRVRMTLSQRQWQGQTRNNVDRVQPVPGGGLVGPGIPVPSMSGPAPAVPQPGAPVPPGAPVQPPAAVAPAPAAPAAPVAPQPPAEPVAAPVTQPAPVPVEQPPAQQAPPALPF
jgi:hypothetical protein